jgi:transcriptional regulator with XRE-family HTH domain
MKKHPYCKLGNKLAAARKSRKWTQRETAASAKITVVYLSRIERGHTRASLKLLERLAKLFGITAGALLK